MRAQIGIATPNLRLSSGIIDFGSVAVGSYKDTTIIISDIGCDSLTNLVVQVNAPFFVVNSMPISLGPGNSDSLQIIFKPTASGFDSASLQSHMNFAGFTSLVIDTSLTLEGSGIAVSQGVQASIINFGQVPVGSYKDVSIMLTNAGCDTIEIYTLETDLPCFVVNPNTITIAPGESDSLHIQFKPTATGFDSGIFIFQSNAANLNIDTFILEGTGIAAPADVSILLAEPLNFLTYPNPASSSFEFSYNLVNPGRAVLKLYDISGTEVATLNDDEETAGSHSVAFNTSGYASGEYFCVLRITSAGRVISSNYCKVVIAKP
jgi:hypothetical protein